MRVFTYIALKPEDRYTIKDTNKIIPKHKEIKI